MRRLDWSCLRLGARASLRGVGSETGAARPLFGAGALALGAAVAGSAAEGAGDAAGGGAEDVEGVGPDGVTKDCAGPLSASAGGGTGMSSFAGRPMAILASSGPLSACLVALRTLVGAAELWAGAGSKSGC